MEKSDLLFKSACQKWHARFGKSIKESNAEDAGVMRKHVERQINAWIVEKRKISKEITELERMLADAKKKHYSARLRASMLEQLYIFMKRGERVIRDDIRRLADKKTAEGVGEKGTKVEGDVFAAKEDKKSKFSGGENDNE